MMGPSTWRAIACTASKSPGDAIGKPASMTSTPSRDSCCAISSFSLVFSEIPGDCSPSRRVVSKMITRSSFMSLLSLACSPPLLAGFAASRPPRAIPPEGGGEEGGGQAGTTCGSNGTGAGAAVLVRRGLPAVELAVVARGELLEAVAEASDVGVVDPQLARRAQRPLLLLAGGLECRDLVAELGQLLLGGARQVLAVLLERLQDLHVVLVGGLALLGEDLELRLFVGHGGHCRGDYGAGTLR